MFKIDSKDTRNTCYVKGCNKYGYKFDRTFNYNRHMKNVHGIEPTTTVERSEGYLLRKSLPEESLTPNANDAYLSWFAKEAGTTITPLKKKYLLYIIKMYAENLFNEARENATVRAKAEAKITAVEVMWRIMKKKIPESEKEKLVSAAKSAKLKKLEGVIERETSFSVKYDFAFLKKLCKEVERLETVSGQEKGHFSYLFCQRKPRKVRTLRTHILKYIKGWDLERTCPFCNSIFQRRNRHFYKFPCNVMIEKIKLVFSNPIRLFNFLSSLVNITMKSDSEHREIKQQIKEEIINKLDKFEPTKKSIKKILAIVYGTMKKYFLIKPNMLNSKAKWTSHRVSLYLSHQDNGSFLKGRLQKARSTYNEILGKVLKICDSFKEPYICNFPEPEVDHTKFNSTPAIEKLKVMLTPYMKNCIYQPKVSNGFFFFDSTDGFSGFESVFHTLAVFQRYENKWCNQDALKLISQVNFLSNIKSAFISLPEGPRDFFTCKFLSKSENVYRAYHYYTLRKEEYCFFPELLLEDEIEEARRITSEAYLYIREEEKKIQVIKDAVNSAYGYLDNRYVNSYTPILLLKKYIEFTTYEREKDIAHIIKKDEEPSREQIEELRIGLRVLGKKRRREPYPLIDFGKRTAKRSKPELPFGEQEQKPHEEFAYGDLELEAEMEAEMEMQNAVSDTETESEANAKSDSKPEPGFKPLDIKKLRMSVVPGVLEEVKRVKNQAINIQSPEMQKIRLLALFKISQTLAKEDFKHIQIAESQEEIRRQVFEISGYDQYGKPKKPNYANGFEIYCGVYGGKDDDDDENGESDKIEAENQDGCEQREIHIQESLLKKMESQVREFLAPKFKLRVR